MKVEQLGCEGKVEEAQGVMKLCDQLKSEREMLQLVRRIHNYHNLLQLLVRSCLNPISVFQAANIVFPDAVVSRKILAAKIAVRVVIKSRGLGIFSGY